MTDALRATPPGATSMPDAVASMPSATHATDAAGAGTGTGPAAAVSPATAVPALDSLPWAAREQAARQAVTTLAKEGPGEVVLSILRRLAADPKWEVRRVVAEALEVLPQAHFQGLAGLLLADRNRFVRTVAERAQERREQGARAADRRSRSSEMVQQHYATLVERHGQKVADQAMRMSLAMYDTLVGASVHEMRNVITPLKAATRHLQQHMGGGVVDVPQATRRLTAMSTWIGTLERLLDDMRTYTLPTPGDRTPERLSDLVQQACQMAREWFPGRGLDISQIHIDVEVPDGILVPVSRHQVLMAIKNVIKNAIDAFALNPTLFRAGSVTVRGSAIDGWAQILVIDTGIGLSPVELDELRRFIPGRTSKPHGTGYGLPTAQRRIAEHGGSLQIDSVEDVGTSVLIRLPLVPVGSGDA